ncbi:MAG TPA: sigma-70 family RNA polymerase sigma factor [Opitutaceae bacterium]|nr:sigma-70 family RNA polymerase sigma factor [Opitutaceae bacterium]
MSSPAPRANGPPADPMAPRCDEAALIRATLAGDQQGFAGIVRAHHRRVYNFLYQMTRHRHDAEDLTQQTFIRAYHHLARFDLERPLINWLFTIARHAALNHFRGAKKWTEIPFDAAGSEPSPARTAESRDRAANLWDRARAILPPREFEVLWLRFAEDLSTEETARVAGLTQTHVKVLVYRARQALLKGET